ncbi:MAG: YbhB/YbcL family Raf kinase inhibitor-like protein [Psychromonas sp.]|nr:YbhB/YbcL family Raf kinase inhibitor-like protein [Alteromonadales bacterium]MCP5078344.1 YbhB/YbcL family Raf kinase inhibitor-like protein [Psychromonas sp.]
MSIDIISKIKNTTKLVSGISLLAFSLSGCNTDDVSEFVDSIDSDINTETNTETNSDSSSDFQLSSPMMEDGETMPITYTCDAEGVSPPLSWSNAPDGVQSYALAMHHEAGPGDTHWYWVVYDIPADVTELDSGEISVGTFGINGVNQLAEYTPPCSKGPGEKSYSITLYALSETPSFTNNSIDRDTLLSAIDEITIDSASLQVSVERDGENEGQGGGGPDNGGPSGYNIEQAISEQAQKTTIGYSGLAFLTGNMCADSFLPPGKVADFFGYQYLRDNTANGMGHNTNFVTNSANNVLSILDDTQLQQVINLAETQVSIINEFAYKRLPLINAFRIAYNDDAYALNKQAVTDYAVQLQLIDAQVSIERAKLFGSVIRTLSDEQTAFLDSMVTGGFEQWPELSDQVDKTQYSHDQHVLIMTFASEMFGWYAGSVEADTYIAPERQANYFGSFYMKDAPAMGNENYTIDETITGSKGEQFITLLTEPQATLITDLVDIQYDNLVSIVDVREQISIELRKFLTQDSIDEDKVYQLATSYGALDGENSYNYATNYAQVGDSLSSEQYEQLMALRDLDAYPCADSTAYIYSELTQLTDIQDNVDLANAYNLVE